ncbi:MAG: STAS domain-containing protein [Candidatus Eremiobacteraeota bacterium]|nr:STAS domain-containing protein [Candidatus Eremiobacteraeota bacterium]
MTERNCVTIVLEGEFDIGNLTELSRRLKAGEVGDDVLIDCSHLDYIDSTGLTQLFKLHQTIENSGGSVYLTGTSTHIRKLFTLTRLDSIFKFRD